jgi:DNA polymerase III delta subunit
MSSNLPKVKSFFPWEYEREIGKDFFESPGLYGLSCQDPYVSKIISRFLLKEKTYQIKTADEITLEWFEDTIGGYDLFATEKIVLIMNGEDLKDVDFFIKGGLDWGENYILVLFNSEKKNYLKMSKVDPGHFLKVSAPKSWHAEKLIDFYLKSMNLRLSRNIIEYLAEAIPLDSALLMNAIKTLFNDQVTIGEIFHLCR